MSYFLYPLAVCLFVFSYRYLVTFLQFRKLVLQYAEFQTLTAKTVPGYYKQLFKIPIAALAAYGFKPCCYIQTRPVAKLEPPTATELLLYHSEYKTYAIAAVRLLAESTDLFEISFYTYFQDKTLLLTLNGKADAILGEIPQAVVQDAYSVDLATHWQLHQQRLAQLATVHPVCGLASVVFLKLLQAHLKQYVDQFVQIKILKQTQPSEWRLSWQAALRQTCKTVQFSGKVAKLTQQRRRSSPQVDIPVELEILSYQRMEFLQQDLVGRKVRTWLLLGSLTVFLISYTQVFNSETLLLFVAALSLHEGGHLLTMRLFGYRNTALLFLPFLGALATARKEDATLSQKFWVSLMGPLPGLILGIGLLAATHSGSSNWLTSASWILISLNLFNLLPIYPLDGGQIADLLIFSRNPYLGVVFKSFGVLLLALLGLMQPMLLIFAGLIAVSIPSSFRAAKATVKLRQNLPFNSNSPDRETLLHTIFASLKQLGYGNLPFAQRYGLAKNLLTSHRQLHAKRRTRLGLSLLYCTVLSGSIVGTLQASIPTWTTALTSYMQGSEKRMQQFQTQQQQIKVATAALQANPDNREAYLDRAQAKLALHDRQGALADYDQVIRLQPNHIPTRLSRAIYRSASGNYQGALQDYNQILQLDPQNVTALQRRASLHMLLKDYQRAIADYSTAIELHPSDSWVYLGRGQARQALKDYQGAIADANAVLRQEEHPDAYALRSSARRSLGDTQGAIADQQKAESLSDTEHD